MEIGSSKRCTAIVADDDSAAAKTIKVALGQLRCDVRKVRTANDVLATFRAERCGLVIVATGLPGLDPGFLCEELRGETPRPRVVLLVDRHDADTLTAALATGADDALAKPLIPAEVMARLRNAREIVMLEDYRRYLEGEGALLAEISTRSSLHGWRYLRAQLGNEVMRARRFAHSLSLVLVEVGGADSRERDLRSCYHLLADAFRARVDWIARHDERTLALVLPETGLAGAMRTAERMRERLLSAAPSRGTGTSTRQGALPRVVHLGVSALEAEHVTVIAEEAAPLLLEAGREYLHNAMSMGPNQIAGGPAVHS
ncbi:MAG TPA: response regulator [Gammaproteobacteria bacterium]|nr:response regulator [Gammaproteobacteria bacterium]